MAALHSLNKIPHSSLLPTQPVDTTLLKVAGSTGRCNTIYSVDPTALPQENRFAGLSINWTLARMVFPFESARMNDS